MKLLVVGALLVGLLLLETAISVCFVMGFMCLYDWAFNETIFDFNKACFYGIIFMFLRSILKG